MRETRVRGGDIKRMLGKHEHTSELTTVRGKAEIRDRRQGDVRDVEALDPFAVITILQFQAKEILLEVRQLCLSGHRRVPDSPGAAARELGALSVMIMVVTGLAVSQHGRDVGEHNSRTVVLIGVEEDSKTLEFVNRAENGTGKGALLRDPHGEAVAVEMVVAVDFEFPFDFPVCSGERETRPDPAGGALPVLRGEANVPTSPVLVGGVGIGL